MKIQYMEVIEQIHDQAFAPESFDVPPEMQGWIDGPNFKHYFCEAISREPNAGGLVVVEVGSWKGLSACIMCEYLRDAGKDGGSRVIAIDTWLGSPEHVRQLGAQRHLGYPTLYAQFLSNVRFHGCEGIIYPFPISSVQGGHFLEQNGVLADIVYIDAGHEYDAVIIDIIVFWRILRPGGTMILDDFSWPGVRRAITEFTTANSLDLDFKGNVACIIKPTTTESKESDELSAAAYVQLDIPADQ